MRVPYKENSHINLLENNQIEDLKYFDRKEEIYSVNELCIQLIGKYADLKLVEFDGASLKPHRCGGR
jgi:hypothetical protein